MPAATSLPERYLITPEPDGVPPLAFLGALSRSLATGIRLVQLRSKSMDTEIYRHLAHAAIDLCSEFDARLVLNGPDVNLDGCGQALAAAGIHLTGARLHALTCRPLPADRLVSAACHTLADLRQAERIGADLVTLSPVLATATHPEAEPMGWERFAELAAAIRVPVFALGGMTPDLIATAQRHGAHGIAAIRGLWAVPEAEM